MNIITISNHRYNPMAHWAVFFVRHNYDGCKTQNSHSVTIMGFLLMSAFLRPVLGGLGQFLYMHFLDLTLGIRFEPVLSGLILIISKPNHITILK